MPSSLKPFSRHFANIVFIGAIFLGGCAQQSLGPDGVYDPAEPINRSVHAVNKAADRAVLRPLSQGYAAITPDPVETMIANGASNLSLPADAANHLLQGDIEASLAMSARFVLNSTIGLLGFFDPATTLNLPDDSTDFGETLHVWGVGEGPYVELPLLGPSTGRDAVGRIVDTVSNPLGYILPAEADDAVLALQGLEILHTRHTLTGVIDPVLYGAEDSYSAARVGYLLNRRSELKGGAIEESDLDDPFAFDP